MIRFDKLEEEGTSLHGWSYEQQQKERLYASRIYPPELLVGAGPADLARPYGHFGNR